MPAELPDSGASSRQDSIDRENSGFWDELCGSSLARAIGVADASPESLRRFDRAYLEMYPYLSDYLPAELSGKRVLEIGLGYGTLGQLLVERGAEYHGLDIAEGPVQMMRARLARLGAAAAAGRVRRGSALDLPYGDQSFDCVISIGCLHHTGNLRRAVEEVARVLAPAGTAIVMLYNRGSWRQFAIRLRRVRGRGVDDEEIRAAYDANTAGEAAPTTEFVSRAEVRELFSAFRDVRIRAENFDHLRLPRGRHVPRRLLLNNVARIAGLDLYVVATR